MKFLSIQITLISCFLCFFTIPLVTFAEDNLPIQFAGDTSNSNISMDFSLVDELLDASVLDMGSSKRSKAKRNIANIGTRLKQIVNTATDNEGNRFSYELFNKEQKENLNVIKIYLENIPAQTPLNLYSKEEQLAYWLNLYNVTLIKEVVKVYPRSNLKSLLTSGSSILDDKLIKVSEISLSLNDIHHNILFNKYDKDPLIIYGLYQGIIGGPNIRDKAYTGNNVYNSLKDNATEFINSNRGTRSQKNNKSLKISSFYKRNANFFPKFHNNVKKHLLQFSHNDITNDIIQAKKFIPSINNWKITDLYGSVRTYGGSANTNSAAALDASPDPAFSSMVIGSANKGGKFKLSADQFSRLRQLMRTRAINMGGTSVTVTDLDSEDK
jgi:hypothetical protein